MEQTLFVGRNENPRSAPQLAKNVSFKKKTGFVYRASQPHFYQLLPLFHPFSHGFPTQKMAQRSVHGHRRGDEGRKHLSGHAVAHVAQAVGGGLGHRPSKTLEEKRSAGKRYEKR